MSTKTWPALRHWAIAAAVAATLAATGQPARAAWDHPHADGGNTGFVDVATAPAGTKSLAVPGLGSFAHGSGPVVGPDGTVYLGTLEGKLVALHADGSKAWSRQLPQGERIVASPVVGSDGSVYVVGVGPNVGGHVQQMELHKFKGGGWLWHTQFPDNQDASSPYPLRSIGTTATPNIWRFGGAEAVIVPSVYRAGIGTEVRIAAFAADGGAVQGDARISYVADTITGGNGRPDWANLLCLVPPFVGCLMGSGFQGPAIIPPADPFDLHSLPELPGVAVYTFPGGGVPWIVAADHMHDIVGFTFSPQGGFVERTRVHDEAHEMRAPAMVLPSTLTYVGTADGALLFQGQAVQQRTPIGGLGGVYEAPTQLADGRVVATEYQGSHSGLAVLRGSVVLGHIDLFNELPASAAASRTHVFVSTSGGLYTYSADTMQPAGEITLPGGGVAPPAIGADGRLYALASNTLFVFPPPPAGATALQGAGTKGGIKGLGLAGPDRLKSAGTTKIAGLAPTSGHGQGTVEGQGGTTSPSSQTFQAPTTKDGRRLYACQDLSGHGCGKPVAAAFCSEQGFATAGMLDTDTEKVQAETLNGEVCAKKKCKVFTSILCTR